jgi:hypothetical protein
VVKLADVAALITAVVGGLTFFFVILPPIIDKSNGMNTIEGTDEELV